MPLVTLTRVFYFRITQKRGFYCMTFNFDKENHFSAIANSYQNLRTTDEEPIAYILENLKSHKNLDIIDLGCGTGRYDVLLLDELDDDCRITGVDANQEMLDEFSVNMKLHRHSDFHAVSSTIEEFPKINSKRYDVVLSFNALHHFNLGKLLTLISQILSPNGVAFLFTRTRNQNQRSILGKYFPKFDYYESRLVSLTEMENTILDTSGIELSEIKVFKYLRKAKLEELVLQVNNHHYSTFSIYEKEELEESIYDFEQLLRYEFDNSSQISWIDRNVMFKIVKSRRRFELDNS